MCVKETVLKLIMGEQERGGVIRNIEWDAGIWARDSLARGRWGMPNQPHAMMRRRIRCGLLFAAGGGWGCGYAAGRST